MLFILNFHLNHCHDSHGDDKEWLRMNVQSKKRSKKVSKSHSSQGEKKTRRRREEATTCHVTPTVAKRGRSGHLSLFVLHV